MTKLDAGLMTSLPASDLGSAAVWGSKRINPRPQSCLCLTWSEYPSNDDDNDFMSNILSMCWQCIFFTDIVKLLGPVLHFPLSTIVRKNNKEVVVRF